MEEFERQIKIFAANIDNELKGGNLSFPTVFDLSMRIKKLADDPSSSLDDMSNVVRTEPLLSARVLRSANTVLLNPYQREITSVAAAISRIGSSTLRCLAYAVAADQLARDHRSRQMRLVASGLWMYSIDVASWAYAFSRHLSQGNPDAALLAGLMVSIGQFYLLAKASDYPALEGQLAHFAEFVLLWDEPVKLAVLEAFDLPRDIIDAADMDADGDSEWPPQNLGDIVFLATLAAETPNPFANLLGIKRRPELLEACLGESGRSEFESLLEEARTTRQQMLSAVSDG
jgi:HD-like signal output (HDOD) protein